MIEAKLVTGSTFGPTARQWIELERFEKAPYDESDTYLVMRMSWVLGFDGNLMYLHKAAQQVKVRDCLVSLPDEAPHLFVMRFYENVRA